MTTFPDFTNVSLHDDASPSSVAPPAAPSAGTGTAATSFRATLAPWRLSAPLSRAVALADGPHLLLMGGLTAAGNSSANVTTLDPSTGTVLSTGKLAQGAHDAGGAVLGGRFLLFGGGADSVLGAIQAYNTAQSHAAIIGQLPELRADLSVAGGGGLAYVVGGFDGARLDPAVLGTSDGTNFTTVATLGEPVRYAAAVTLGKYLWVFGGTDGTKPTADIQRVDPAAGRVTVTGHFPAALDHAVALILDGTVLILGGVINGRPSPAIWRLDPATGTVVRSGTMPVPVSMPAAAVVEGVAYLLGGEGTAPLDTVVEIRPVH